MPCPLLCLSQLRILLTLFTLYAARGTVGGASRNGFLVLMVAIAFEDRVRLFRGEREHVVDS